MQLNITKDGFTITNGTTTIYSQQSSPDGGTWGAAKIKTMANKTFDAYFEELVKKPAYQKSRDEFEVSLKKPVVSGGLSWDSNKYSFAQIDAAIRLAELSAATDVVLYDSTNVPHTLLIADAKIVAMAIGIDFQNKLAAKQASFAAIAAAKDQATMPPSPNLI